MAKKQTKPASSWRNRITRTGEMPAGEFMANVKNWRVHPKAQREALRGVLSEVGWVTGVIINKTTGAVVDGHARIEEALKLGEETPVPFIEVELSEDEEAKILASLDPISAMATADKEQLDKLLHEVQTADAGLMQMLDDLAKSSGIVPTDSISDLWQGMPEFQQEDQMGCRQIIVHFETEKDVVDFAKRLGQTITDKAKSIWHPFKPVENLMAYKATDES